MRINKKNLLIVMFLVGAVSATSFCEVQTSLKKVYIDELGASKATSGWGTSQANKSIDGYPLRIGGREFDRGIGTHANGRMVIELNGAGKEFHAFVGIDDEVGDLGGDAEFLVVADSKIVWSSGRMEGRQEAKEVNVDLTGVKQLQLVVKQADGDNYHDHTDWADAWITHVPGATIKAIMPPKPKPYILTPRPGSAPRITGPKIFGVRPGNPFLFTVTATGDRPMNFEIKGLPQGLKLDSKSGRITGKVDSRGEYKTTITATNSKGKAEREFRIVVGDTICLTPPMGWNSWNCWACAVDDEKVRTTAKAMVDSGLINHGWSYINIDDCWMRKEGDDDPAIGGPARDSEGNLIPNAKFPDMKGLTDYIHDLGLKVGTYISPGPTTCQRYVGSWEHELQDAIQFAQWGFDYLKYDWCGYSKVSGNKTQQDLQRPYILMGQILKKVDRDIVYSLCQYGWGEVWKWGADVGGNCWRTTGDIRDTWDSMAGIGFRQADLYQYASPGHWNDPDMLVVGKVGWGPNLHDSRLTPDEQYTHISLWCLLSSPLLIGCPIEQLDEFTLSLLTNDEVLQVNQDPLGKQARRIKKDGPKEIWAKEMEDGSMAVGLFNRDDFDSRTIELRWSDLKLNQFYRVRDLWRQKDIGVYEDGIDAIVPVHGVVMLRIWPIPKTAAMQMRKIGKLPEPK